jgi:trehalose 6-phosphate synthase/phosphatase
MPTTSPFNGNGGGAGSPNRIDRLLRERRDFFATPSPDAMDTDAAQAAFANAPVGVFAPDGFQSPGFASPANMEGTGDASGGNAVRPPLSGHRSGFRRLGLRGTKQRLLVVANRLPVSANRRGEDQWSLEISAGGLVSALLGNSEIHTQPSSHVPRKCDAMERCMRQSSALTAINVHKRNFLLPQA